ncbi:hypothetical protein EOM86_14065, partial [Candidatus Nomurabacteria bacterium]|nr:hypothetical protein [Candidatus Nomurabacteria bacterium]
MKGRTEKMPEGGLGVIRIVTPLEMTGEQAEVLASKFSKLLDVKEYIVRTEIDPSLLGGV